MSKTRDSKGRFKKIKGRKNPAAVKAGKKGHAKSCGLFGAAKKKSRRKRR